MAASWHKREVGRSVWGEIARTVQWAGSWVSVQWRMGSRQSGRGAGCHYQTFSVAGPTETASSGKTQLLQSRSERGGRLAKGLTPHADQVIGFSCVLLPGQLTHSTMYAAGQRQKLLSGEDAGHTAASGSAVILTELPLQFGLSCSRRQVGVTQLPEQQGRRCRQLLLVFSFSAALPLLRGAEFPFVFALGSLHSDGWGLRNNLQ